MTETVIFVDDEPQLLAGFRRALRGRYRVETAESARAALARFAAARLQRQPGYAVIVADMRMPGMDGAELLATVKRIAPETVRVMLTGLGDQETAAQAVNEGSIFRFLTKPCDPPVLTAALDDALRQYRLTVAERELLEQTLGGAVKVLTDLLALVNPTAFGRAARVRELTSAVAGRLRLPDAWQLELAAMLSQVGAVTVPEPTLRRAYRGEELSAGEAAMVADHPALGADLIGRIPRLAEVAAMIREQASPAAPHEAGPAHPPTGAAVLRLALDMDGLAQRGYPPPAALAALRARAETYDGRALNALAQELGAAERYQQRRVAADELAPGMRLAEDLVTGDGVLLVSRGQEVTPTLRARLRNFGLASAVQGAIAVLVPAGSVPASGAATA